MKRIIKKESGEVMLEGMIVMVITMLMMVWILGVGFLYYQKYTVRIVSNDVAKKIAATYDAPSSDIIMGYMSVEDITGRGASIPGGVDSVNDLRADSYVKYILDKANFYNTVDDADVNLESYSDAMGRSHVKVTTTCTFNTPFGAGLEIFGMSGKRTYTVTSYADSTSLTEYVNFVTMGDMLTNGAILANTGFLEKTVTMINSLISTYNQLTG